jgi:hypothetical protein
MRTPAALDNRAVSESVHHSRLISAQQKHISDDTSIFNSVWDDRPTQQPRTTVRRDPKPPDYAADLDNADIMNGMFRDAPPQLRMTPEVARSLIHFLAEESWSAPV